MTVLHEMFQTLQTVGFTEDQSLKLLSLMMTKHGEGLTPD